MGTRARRHSIQLVSIILLAVTGATTSSVAEAQIGPVAPPAPMVTGPVTNGMIATFAWRPGAHISDTLDLVVLKSDGTGAEVLVAGAAERSLCGFDLDWSPDGNRIAWASGGQVWTINADGTGRQLVNNGCVSHVEWSPDGGSLAVEIDGRTGLLELGSGAFRWVRPCAFGEGGATFSPDGSTLATVATAADCNQGPTGWGVYGFTTANGALDGLYADTNLRGQPPTQGWDAVPDGAEWHPTQDLVMTVMDDSWQGGSCHPLGQTGSWTNSDVLTVPAAHGSQLTRVGNTTGEYDWSERDASWSPDGQRILFSGSRNLACENSSYVQSGVQLFTMAPDGSGRISLWSPPNPDFGFFASSWQPCTPSTVTCVPPPPLDGGGTPPPDGGGTPPPPSPPPPPGDTTAPQTAISKHPKKTTTKRTAKFVFRSNETGSTFRCKLDKKAYKRCTSPKKYKVKIGKHKFRVYAIDAAGIVDPKPAVWKWKVKR